MRLPRERDVRLGDPGRLDDERRQAAFIAQSYATSLFAGVQRHFFFILGNYIENEVQFGLLRHDHTPRPGYVALAAVGRFLAGSVPGMSTKGAQMTARALRHFLPPPFLLLRRPPLSLPNLKW